MNGRPLGIAYNYRGNDRLDDDPTTAICHGARGTIAGYGRHVRRGEKPCEKCRAAMNAYNRERRHRWESNPATKAADRLRRKARARALAALAKRHPQEFAALQRIEIGRLLADGAA